MRRELGSVVEPAARLARSTLGEEARVTDPVLLKAGPRARVVRLRVETRGGDVTSLIAKHVLGDEARGFSDWASLEFLTGIEAASGLAPRFVAGDRHERLLLMQDLGPGRTLADVLEAGDPTEIVAILRRLGTRMARLVLASRGREADYLALRRALPAAEETGRLVEARRWRRGLGHVSRWLDVLELRPPAGFTDSAERVAAGFAEPRDRLAFSHGDPAPTNNHVSGEGVCLVDFEYGAYRHALYDLSGWYVLCPLPAGWASELSAAFRRRLGRDAGVLSDEVGFREAWAAMCAYRALAMIGWFPLRLVRENLPWVEDWSMREAMLSAAHRLHAATLDVPSLAPLAELSERLCVRLRSRWPEHGDGRIHWRGAPIQPARSP